MNGSVAGPTPRVAATIALVRDGQAGIEVWMMRRVSAMSFAAGAVVLPGGGWTHATPIPGCAGQEAQWTRCRHASASTRPRPERWSTQLVASCSRRQGSCSRDRRRAAIAPPTDGHPRRGPPPWRTSWRPVTMRSTCHGSSPGRAGSLHRPSPDATYPPGRGARSGRAQGRCRSPSHDRHAATAARGGLRRRSPEIGAPPPLGAGVPARRENDDGTLSVVGGGEERAPRRQAAQLAGSA